ncbi:MAG: AzlD domain-containing protein [Betaproteobacteria bacterium]|nr:AzlD domain-containing protein [Betaproteobacteria bacterium]
MAAPLSSLDAWILIAIMTVVSFLPRAVFLLFAPDLALPEPVKRALRYVPAAVFPALIMPAVLITDGRIDFSADNARLAAAAVAALVAVRRGNTFIVVLAGMVTLHAMKTLHGA